MTTILNIEKTTRDVISVEKVTDNEGFERLRHIWNELVHKNDIDRIFLNFEWINTWWKIFGGGARSLYILVVRSNDEIIGIAPLMLTRSGKSDSSRIIEFIGTPNIDYADIIGANKELVVSEILKFLNDHKEDWTKVDLAQIPEGAKSLDLFEKIASEKTYQIVIETAIICPALIYDGKPEDIGKYTVRKPHSVKRAINGLSRKNKLFLERLRDPVLIKQRLLTFYQFHVNRWGKTATPSKFLDPGHRRFYEELADKFAPAGALFFGEIRNGEIPMAYCFGYEYKGNIIYSTVALNSVYSKLSPGQIMFCLQADKYIREGYTIDYSRGEQHFKEMLSNTSKTNFRVVIYSKKSDFNRMLMWKKIKATRPVLNLAKNESIQSIKTTIERKLSFEGIRGVVRGSIRRLAWLFRKAILDYRKFDIFKISSKEKQHINPYSDIGSCNLKPDQIELIGSFYGIREDSPEYRRLLDRFTNGAECFAALFKGQIAAISWGMRHHEDYSFGLKLKKMRKDQVLLCDTDISPLYPDLDLRRNLLEYQIEYYKSKGVETLIALGRKNRSLAEALGRFNISPSYTARQLTLFGKKKL